MKKGFTLAEILITLSIVGIVAVLTIPSVMKSYKNRMYTAKLEKVYSQLNNATSALMNDERVDNFYETQAGKAPAKNAKGEYIAGFPYFANTYLKNIKKDCLDSSEPCATQGAGTYKTVTGVAVGGFVSSYCVQTVNGVTVCGVYNSAKTCMSLAVDVNGMDGPNIPGRDVFSMDIHKDGSISDFGSNCNDSNFGCEPAKCTKSLTVDAWAAACGCLSAIIDSGWKMEY